MLLKRSVEKRLLQLLSWFPAVGILGTRQVGKTTLSKEIISLLPKESIYLDLELPSHMAKLDEAELYLKQHQNKCVIIDEIQRKPELLPLMRALIDQNRVPCRFLILGSANPGLIRNASEALTGRISYIELFPLNIKEVRERCSYREHWFRGGFPEALLSPSAEKTRLWLDSFIRTYIEKDLPLLGLNVSPRLLTRFWIMMAHYHGGIFNSSDFGRALGISHVTVNRYIDFMESAFLLYRLNPFYGKPKKRLVKSPKIYIRDSGILHRLAGISEFEELQGNVLIGPSWEGYIIEQIRSLLNQEMDLYYYRTHGGAECDLVIVKSNQVVACIEIKYTSTPTVNKGLVQSINDLGSSLNFIVTPESDDYLIRKNIRVCSLTDFINQYLPGDI